MRIGYIDCFCGISGDMLLGALIDCGWPEEELRGVAAAVGARGVTVQRVRRGALSALAVRVDAPASGPRGLEEVLAVVDAAPVDERARHLAGKAFRLLACAEGRIHGIEPSKVHFHEVGAVDALVDILGSAAGIVALGLERLHSVPPPLGSGTVSTDHGVLPVPAPAAAELLRGFPVRFDGEAELTTPTGAALLRALVDECAPPPSMRLETVGYGAGSRQDPGRVNVLRLFIGETLTSPADLEELVELATNVDDLDPRLVPVVIEAALAAGALDAWAETALGKKGRPCFVIRMLCRPGDESRLAELLLSETPTLGVRWGRVLRRALPRKFLKVETRFGIICVKAALRPTGDWDYAPEFDDCHVAAEAARVPLAVVVEDAIHMARREGDKGPSKKEEVD